MQPHRLQLIGLKNTGVGCHFLLQEIFPTQGLNLSLLHCRRILYHGSTWDSPLRWFFCLVTYSSTLPPCLSHVSTSLPPCSQGAWFCRVGPGCHYPGSGGQTSLSFSVVFELSLYSFLLWGTVYFPDLWIHCQLESCVQQPSPMSGWHFMESIPTVLVLPLSEPWASSRTSPI